MEKLLIHPPSCYNPIKISFLVIVLAHESFLFSLHTVCSHAMLVLILIDVQYLHNVFFSLEKDLNGQNHLPPIEEDFPHPLIAICKIMYDPFQTKIPHQGSF